MMTSTPPMKNGVSASRVYLPAQSLHLTVYSFLCHQFPHISSHEWAQRFHENLVFDQALAPLNINSCYQNNCFIFYYRFLAHETPVPFKHHTLFENEHLIVVDKPHFLTMSPTGQYVQETLLVRLKHQTQNPDLTPIHRLDKDTAGVVMFCKQPQYRAMYQQLFADKKVIKHYHAIAAYRPDLPLPLTTKFHMQKSEPFYTMRIDPHAQPNSETHIQLIEHHMTWAKYLLQPSTGKQHQLRVHLNALGIPIKNDSLYPKVQHQTSDCFTHPLQLLAKQLQFKDPITQQDFTFISSYSLNLSS